MLEFNIQVAGGSLVEINEPIGFDKVDFNLTRSETLHSISSNFAGNSIEFEFNKDVHYNVFDAIIQEYEVNGFLGSVMLFITYNGNELFKGSFDFSATQTDMLNYLKCQIVNKDKLYLLDKNKGVAVDLLSDKDLEQNTVTPALISTLSLPPVELFKESIWEDTQVTSYVMPTAGFSSVFNNAQNTTKYEINNTLSWLERSQLNTVSLGRDFQLVSAKENMKSVSFLIEFKNNTSIYKSDLGSANIRVRLIIHYGDEFVNQTDSFWLNNTNRTTLLDFTLNTSNPSYNLPPYISYSLPDMSRGSGIWLFWLVEGVSNLETAIYSNFGTKITINAISTNFYSLTNSIKYTELVKNAVKKASNINNVIFNADFYDNTYSFNGNLLRQITDKGFDVKWQDIAKQLDERNLGAYYNETTDTLVIDHRNNILGNNLIGSYGDLAKKDFYFVTEDENFIVNKFNYKYNKFQAQKENNVNGNNASVHGESEWYISNKTFEGSVDVDLPFLRDSFMIEDIRQKALEYKEDTATNEDSTIILVETTDNIPPLQVTEKITVNTSFSNDIQTIQNDGSFNWINMGLSILSIVSVNGYNYYMYEPPTRNQLLIYPVTTAPPLNGLQTITFTYTLSSTRLAVLSNGLLNQDFSVRQNIQYWRNTLDTANFYSKTDIINTIYKENKEAVINGLLETQAIDYLDALHTPRVIDSKVMISVDDYFYLKNNKIGYINIFNQNNEQISIYLTELKALFLNGCNQMEATLKGWLRNEIEYSTYIITKYSINNVYYSEITFGFNDSEQTFNIYINGILVYENLVATQICSPTLCYSTYNNAKNYLLSL